MTIESKSGSPTHSGKEIGIASSKGALSAMKFLDFLKKKKIELSSLDKTEAAIREMVSATRLFIPGTTIDDVIENLKLTGFIVPEEKKKKAIEPPEHIERPKVGGKIVEDEGLKKQLEENNFFENLDKDIFRNSAELEVVYERSKSLGLKDKENSVESDYYFQFADLVIGGVEEIQNDLISLNERKELFQKNASELETKKAHRVEKSKKVATIVERAIVYSVSNLQWYGDSVNIEPTSQFDDIKRGVDDVLEIKKEDMSTFMGLGIDVTYRGLLSAQYRDKLLGLLKSMKDGYKVKIKYFKNHKGELMKEFIVPKVILFFDLKDVKDLAYMIKNIDNAEIIEAYKNNPLKFKIMNQIVIQCELLAAFAKEEHNAISEDYERVVSAIKDLSENNEELKNILDSRHEDGTMFHMKYLLEEFKKKSS